MASILGLLFSTAFWLSASAPATSSSPPPSSRPVPVPSSQPTPTSALRTFTVDDLLRLKRVSSLSVSPDGQRLAFVVSTPDVAANRSRTSIWIADNSPGATPRRLTEDDANEQSPYFAADSASVYFLAKRGAQAQVWRQPIDSGTAIQVSEFPLDVAAFRLSPTESGILVAFEMGEKCDTLTCEVSRLAQPKEGNGTLHRRYFVRHWDAWKSGTMSRLFFAPLRAGKADIAPVLLSRLDADVPSKPHGGSEEFVFSPDGKSVYFAARIKGNDEPLSTNLDIYSVGIDGDRLLNLTSANPALDNLPVVSPDGRQLAWVAMSRPGYESDRTQVMVRDLQNGQYRSLSAMMDRGLTNPVWSRDGKTIFATSDDVGQHSLWAGDVKSGKWRRLVREGHVGEVAVGKGQLLLTHDDLAHPAEIFALPENGGTLRKRTAFNDAQMAGLSVGEFQQFRFSGAHNENVYGYVVKPPGAVKGQRFPVALLIHGGPQGSMANLFHYRWNAQLFAAQGFATVMIDFHGSTGYGQAFTDSIHSDWGGKPLEDLQRGLIAAAKTFEFLDLSRACALGGSYGGYMTNWIAGQWPEGFRCLVTHAGIFDNRSMAYTTEELWFDEWDHGGPYFTHSAAFERHNPVSLVGKWKTPTLVIHGELDYRVPIEQGIAAFTALQRRGVPSEFLVFPDENHWILKPRNVQQWYGTVFNWLKQWTTAPSVAP